VASGPSERSSPSARSASSRRESRPLKPRADTVKYEGQGIAAAYIVILLSAVGAFLLIVSGVGYLKQSKFMGRTLGTVYALVSLGGTAVGVVTGGGIGFFTIIFSVYPVLTLIMVNTTFKDDLVN
jgi:hypothetical protein